MSAKDVLNYVRRLHAQAAMAAQPPSPEGPKARHQPPSAPTAPTPAKPPTQAQAVPPSVLDGAIVSSRLTTRLMAAAMRRCDHVGDSEAAREAMRLDVLATPLRLQQDLLDHFTSIAPPTQPAIQRQRQTVTAKPIVSTKAERFGAWEATWKPLAIAYHTHHFNCHLCRAAGKRQDVQRCEVGAGLWDAYQSAGRTDQPR